MTSLQKIVKKYFEFQFDGFFYVKKKFYQAKSKPPKTLEKTEHVRIQPILIGNS